MRDLQLTLAFNPPLGATRVQSGPRCLFGETGGHKAPRRTVWRKPETDAPRKEIAGAGKKKKKKKTERGDGTRSK